MTLGIFGLWGSTMGLASVLGISLLWSIPMTLALIVCFFVFF